jgi:hypothetical protein
MKFFLLAATTVASSVSATTMTNETACEPSELGMSFPGISREWCDDNCMDGDGTLVAACDPAQGLPLCECGGDSPSDPPVGHPELPVPVTHCPHWFDIRSDFVANEFNNEKYQGFWYEHAEQDITQPAGFCGCTTFDWRFLPDEARHTEANLDVLDVFTLHCPKPQGGSGVPYYTNLTIQAFDDLPGYFIESWGIPGGDGNCNGVPGPIADLPFCQRDNTFADMIVDLQVDERGEYDESIQFQCQEDETGIVFTAINFMSKSPTITDDAMEAMFERARALGLGEYMEDGTGTHLVDHVGCEYPRGEIDAFYAEWSENGRPDPVENQRPLVDCLSDNQDQCMSNVGEGGLVMCLVQNDCIVIDENEELDIARITSCVQRIPILNPSPVCGDKIDTIGALACIGTCGEEDPLCIVQCLGENAEFAPGLTDVFQCAMDGGVCEGLATLPSRSSQWPLGAR